MIRMSSLRFRRGMTFIEVLVALGLLGVIVVTIVAAFSSITIATFRHRQQATLDLLVRSDAEYLKSQAYSPKPLASYTNIAAAGYAFSAPLVLFWNPGTRTFSAANAESGLQEISVTVTALNGGTERIIVLKVRP
jgi:prepilin-type N-terminal cleavage/methylation domain-containing protein